MLTLHGQTFNYAQYLNLALSGSLVVTMLLPLGKPMSVLSIARPMTNLNSFTSLCSFFVLATMDLSVLLGLYYLVRNNYTLSSHTTVYSELGVQGQLNTMLFIYMFYQFTMLPVVLWHSRPFKKPFRSSPYSMTFALVNLYRCLNIWLDPQGQETYL